MSYRSINHTLDINHVFALSDVIRETIYSNWYRSEDTIKFEKIRKIIGYLVSTVYRFNN